MKLIATKTRGEFLIKIYEDKDVDLLAFLVKIHISTSDALQFTQNCNTIKEVYTAIDHFMRSH